MISANSMTSLKVPQLSATEWEENDKRVKAFEKESEERKTALRISRAGIPEKYRKASLENVTQDVKDWNRNKTAGLILQGESGRGKTYAACAVLLDNINETTCVFTTSEKLLRELKEAYSFHESEAAEMSRYTSCGLLCIDDLGRERLTEWSMSILFAIIDTRLNENRPTIITTNYCGKELAQRMALQGDMTASKALFSRFRCYTLVSIVGRDLRGLSDVCSR